jgi:hypothetical protein
MHCSGSNTDPADSLVQALKVFAGQAKSQGLAAYADIQGPPVTELQWQAADLLDAAAAQTVSPVAGTMRSMARFLRWLASSEAASAARRLSAQSPAVRTDSAAAEQLSTLLQLLCCLLGPKALGAGGGGKPAAKGGDAALAVPPGLLLLLQAAAAARGADAGTGAAATKSTAEIEDAVSAAVDDVVNLLEGEQLDCMQSHSCSLPPKAI